MTDGKQQYGSADDRLIEDGGTYDHAEHGRVEVTGIWKRTQRIQRLETARREDERDTTVVRFVPGENGEWIDELAEPCGDFLDAIE
ncbi:hypothetical protein [Natronorubrum texcoconense]|uniref:Uncharacterized protein n=1 Tax=Natronorubrum texcoconense TaxID=1095776 RepID=A0A1G8VFC7_9EURY|nr:hypothetical protein [Natronorubrum texcoconense]SDJ64738.1 hypothetical protein SAMN04515672_1314 [Natronorubrum texcoconense]